MLLAAQWSLFPQKRMQGKGEKMEKNDAAMLEDGQLRQLVEKYKKTCDKDSFEALYRQSYSKLYGYLFALGHNRELAEDAIQNGFATCYTKIDQLADGSRFVPWMKQICYRTYLALMSKQDRAISTNGVSAKGEEYDRLSDIPDDGSIGMPEGGIEQEKLQKLLMDVLDSLPELQRLAFISFYYDKKDIGFIAGELGIPENTVKSYLSRGRKSMNLQMRDHATAYGLKLVPFAIVPVIWNLISTEVQACEASVTTDMINASLSTALTSLQIKEAANAARSSHVATLPVKLIAGVTAAVIACGGGAAVMILNRQPSGNKSSVTEKAENRSSAASSESETTQMAASDSATDIQAESPVNKTSESKESAAKKGAIAAESEEEKSSAAASKKAEEESQSEDNQDEKSTAAKRTQEAASAAYQEVIDIIKKCGDEPYNSSEASMYMDYFPMALQYDTSVHGYVLTNIDNDGVDELLLTGGNTISQAEAKGMSLEDCLHAGSYVYAILSFEDGKAVPIVSQGGSRDSYFLCGDGLIGHYAAGGWALWGYEYYTLSAKKLELKECVFHDTLVDQPMSEEETNDVRYFYTTADAFEDKSTEISEDEFNAVLQKHPYIALTPTPIS